MGALHLPASEWHIAACSADCGVVLRSPFPSRTADPDGLGTFAAELTDELGVEADEISITDVARAWARAMGWKEEPDGWYCPSHAGSSE